MNDGQIERGENMSFVITNGSHYIASKKSGGIVKTPHIEEALHCHYRITAANKLKSAPGKCRGYFIREIDKEGKQKKQRKWRKHYSTDARKMIYDKAGGRCVLCGPKILFEDMTLDHIIPLAMNGPDEVDNLQCTCELCNRAKASALPEEFIDRISSIFMYQMEKKYTGRLGWKMAAYILKKYLG